MNRPLVDALRRSQQRERRSFHMPGHKGASGELDAVLGHGIVAADVSEMDGWFPYLQAPDAEMAAAQQLAAQHWGADATYFLVNGTTVGNIAAILACVGDGDEILVCRGSHRSVYAALSLSGATPVYLLPAHHAVLDGGFSVSADDARRLLDAHPQVRAIHLTSPNYYGMCTDLQAFVAMAHARAIPIIVDEAHGAHFALHPSLPLSAVTSGADIVVQSTHKTLGALTQASMLHLRRDGIVDERRLAQQLQTLQSSSPSALLTVSLDIARAEANTMAIDRTIALARTLRSSLGTSRGLTVHDGDLRGSGGVVDADITKVVIDVSGLGRSGYGVADELRTMRGIGVELADGRRIVCSVTVGDTEESVAALAEALRSLKHADGVEPVRVPALVAPTVAMPIRTAERRDTTPMAIGDAAGRVCAEYVIPYPPGIPLVAPGEVVTAAVLDALRGFIGAGSRIVGPNDAALATIAVLA